MREESQPKSLLSAEQFDEILREAVPPENRNQFVRDLRNLGGIRQKELADHLGISEDTVTFIETERRGVTDAMFKRWCRSVREIVLARAIAIDAELLALLNPPSP